jgi:2-polyprenyl-3-methyl-5-hydroxy-6-metoxy-1,4-benzoquinol methylase
VAADAAQPRVNIHSIYSIFQRAFRPRRIRALKAMLPQIELPQTTILDLGGTARWWADVHPATARITIVNIDRRLEHEVRAAGFEFVCADACRLPFADAQFDLVVSNSVIEHVGDAARQAQFAAEMRRCARAVYMQTPNRWFPVEPHLITVGLHWLPAAWQRRLIRRGSVWGWVARPSQLQIDEFIGTTRLLDGREVRQLFPDCEIGREGFLGLTKSFIAARRLPALDPLASAADGDRKAASFLPAGSAVAGPGSGRSAAFTCR